MKKNFINFLTIYKPKKAYANILFLINEEFKAIDLSYNENFYINDNKAIKIYKDGLKIYKKYNLNLKINLSQIHKENEINLNQETNNF